MDFELFMDHLDEWQSTPHMFVVGRENLTMKDIHISGFYYYLSRGITSTGLNLKDFLRSDDGLKLARKYGYQSNTYVDNLTHRFTDYF